MIKMYVKGNLVTMLARSVESDNPIVIAHGCNCQDAMHSGIAWELQRAFPQIREADTNYFNEITNNSEYFVNNVCMLGQYSTALVSKSLVINLYTQYFPGRDYCAKTFEQAFTNLNNMGIKGNIYIPRIGAGVCGGDWNEIEAIINKCTPDTNIVVVDWDGTIHDDTEK